MVPQRNSVKLLILRNVDIISFFFIRVSLAAACVFTRMSVAFLEIIYTGVHLHLHRSARLSHQVK